MFFFCLNFNWASLHLLSWEMPKIRSCKKRRFWVGREMLASLGYPSRGTMANALGVDPGLQRALCLWLLRFILLLLCQDFIEGLSQPWRHIRCSTQKNVWEWHAHWVCSLYMLDCNGLHLWQRSLMMHLTGWNDFAFDAKELVWYDCESECVLRACCISWMAALHAVFWLLASNGNVLRNRFRSATFLRKQSSQSPTLGISIQCRTFCQRKKFVNNCSNSAFCQPSCWHNFVEVHTFSFDVNFFNHVSGWAWRKA